MENKNREDKFVIYDYTVILLFIIIALFLFQIVSLFMGKYIEGYAYWYLLYIIEPYETTMFRIFQYIPLIGNYYIYILSFISSVLTIVMVVLTLKKNSDKKLLEKLTNIAICFYLITIFLVYKPILNNNMRLNVEKVDKLYFNENLDKKYNIDDLILLDNQFKELVLFYANNLERDDNRIKYDKDITKESVKSLQNISDEFYFLKGKYINRIRDFTNVYRKHNTEGTVGLTMGYAISMDYSYEKIGLIQTATHELCHMKGLTRENETVFCQVIANSKYDDDVVKYAGYLEAFTRTTYALKLIDFESTKTLSDEVDSLCLTHNYQEICESHRKDINNYIVGTNNIQLKTYLLKDYENYQNGFIDFITKLVNDYDAKITINKEISLDEFKYSINNNSYEIALITVKIDKNTFNELYEDLNNYQNYFYSIYQFDENDEVDEKLTKQEYIEKYIKPYDHYDKEIFFSSSYASYTYDYERVTRLFLEYFDGVDLLEDIKNTNE